MKLSSRLVKSRHGIYYYRLQQSGIDKRWSLGTREPSQAAILAHKISARILSMKIDPTKVIGWTLKSDGKNIELQTEDNDADRQSAKEALDLLVQSGKLNLSSKVQKGQQKTKRLTSAITEYEAYLTTTDQSLKTQKMTLSLLRKLSTLLGPTFNMAQLNDNVFEDIWLPDRLLAVKKTTAKRDLTLIRIFVAWAADTKRQYCPETLTFTFSAEAKHTEDNHWEHFTRDDLALIFGKLHLKARNSWQFWVPVIALYTGSRVGEIASLKAENFSEKSGIPIMKIVGTKTKASTREVPIHDDLIRLGLLDYVAAIRAKNKKQLFNVAMHNQNGPGATPSKWFTTYKNSIGIGEKKVFHSFRTTIVDCLKQNGVLTEERCQYVGHESSRSTHNDVYARKELNIKSLKLSVVDKIDYKSYCGFELDFDALKKKAESFL